MDPQLQSFHWFRWETVWRQGRLSLKELREILRDRRTIVTLFLMPLLLYPLLSIAMQQFFMSEYIGQVVPEFLIGVESDDDYNFINAYLQLGDLSRSPEEQMAKGQPVLKFFEAPQSSDAVRNGDVDLSIRLHGDLPSVIDPQKDMQVEWEIFHSPDSINSQKGLEHIQGMLQRSDTAFLNARLRILGVTQSSTPAKLRIVDVEMGKGSGTGVSLVTVIPLILILMTITGAVYPAIDLTAGERERGTLEILVAAPVSRISLLFAKYVAVLTVAMLTATVNLVMMTLTVLVSGLGPVLFGDAGLSVRTVVQVFCLLLLFAAFFSSLLLALTSFARSFKEAQAYLIPLMLASMGPGMISIMPGMELGGVLTVAPLINIVLLARDLFQGTANPVSAAVVIFSTLLYAFAAIGLAARIFGAEDVLYGDHGGWSAFWHRAKESRAVPTVSSAMFCLAVMFPAHFTLSSAIGLLGGESVMVRLILASVVTVLLFVGIPFLASRSGHVRLASGFNLRVPTWPTLLLAVVLGLTLWPMAHEIVVWKVEFGLVEFNPAMQERVEGMLAKVRELPLPVVVFCLALIPACCEELFFRGYLFSALRSQTGPRSSIFTSALLFGLFHLVVTDRLAFERFLPSTLMGVVLGWVCLRTGSVFPGMLLHATHNGFLICVAYYKQQLADHGIGVEERSHLPMSWVIGGAVVAAGAFFALEWVCGSAERQPANKDDLE